MAASTEELGRLHEAMRIDELLVILRDEGVQQAELLRDDLAPGRGGSSWPAQVSGIYDMAEMTAGFRTAFADEIGEVDVTPLIDFFESERGRRIVELELDGRRAISDPDVEATARAAVDGGTFKNTERGELLRGFIEVNDLVDYNVMGALNSNLAFLLGLETGKDAAMNESEIVATVWEREAEIRADSEEWLMAYLAMAYEPLSDEDLNRYIELSASEAGRNLNRALFAGFDAVFNDVSFSLGRAVSRLMVGQDL